MISANAAPQAELHDLERGPCCQRLEGCYIDNTHCPRGRDDDHRAAAGGHNGQKRGNSKMQGKLLATLAFPAALMSSVATLSDPVEGYQGYGPHMMWGNSWAGWIFGPLMMLLVIAGIVAAVVIVARSVGHSGHVSHGPAPGPAPLDILKQRFARGEIDKDEFEERRRVLGD